VLAASIMSLPTACCASMCQSCLGMCRSQAWQEAAGNVAALAMHAELPRSVALLEPIGTGKHHWVAPHRQLSMLALGSGILIARYQSLGTW
jgi:hypothetical protein